MILLIKDIGFEDDDPTNFYLFYTLLTPLLLHLMSLSHTKISKFLSYILRHHPEDIGLDVDARGWAHLPSLISKAQNNGRSISKKQIMEVMEKSDKQRFTLSDDGEYIRAGYGHSIDVELGLEPKSPPVQLFHGTAQQNVVSILETGLQPQDRTHVHLSDNIADAQAVGSRHGQPQILGVQAQKMYAAGFPFYQSDSEPAIWLVQKVPPKYITEP